MTPVPFVVTPETYAPALDLLGVRITVLAANEATGGYEITLQEGPEGAGPPPHRHAWDEAFFVLSGDVEMSCAGAARVAGPGTLVHVPAGTLHGYRFGAGGVRMLEVTGHGGHATRMFANVSRAKLDGPEQVPELLALLLENGVAVAT